MKNVVLLTGRAGSKSVKNKNVYPILGRPLCFYPIYNALEASKIDEIYVSTDCDKIKKVAGNMGIRVIDRPDELAEDTSELIDAITHALSEIGQDIKYLITMHCNCAVHRPGIIDECIARMDADPDADSCVTGFIDKSIHPFRTKKIGISGYLSSWLDVPDHTSTNRQNLEPCFVLDGAVRVLRVGRCFPPTGQPPFTYLGNKILYVENMAGGDVHSTADIAKSEFLLAEMGWKSL